MWTHPPRHLRHQTRSVAVLLVWMVAPFVVMLTAAVIWGAHD